MKTSLKTSLEFGALAVLAFGSVQGFCGTEVREKLVSGLSGRPYGAVLFDGSLYFSVEQNQSGECPAANVFRVAAKPDANKAVVVDFVAEVPCLRKLQVVGKRLFVFERVQGAESVRMLEQGNWVSVPQSSLKDVYADRMAWLGFRLDSIADKAADPAIAQSAPIAWSFAESSPAGGKGLNLSMLLRSSTGKIVHYQMPLEDGSKKVRPIFEVAGLPADFAPGKFEIVQSKGKLLIYEIAGQNGGEARMFLWDIAAGGAATQVTGPGIKITAPTYVQPVADGFLIVDSHRSVYDTAWGAASQAVILSESGDALSQPGLDADVSGITPVEGGYLISKGFSGEIATVGASLKWTKELTGFKALPIEAPRLPAFPKLVRACKSHSLHQEQSDLWSIQYRGTRESVPLGFARQIASAACNGDSLAIVAKSIEYNLAFTRLALTPEEGEAGIDGGTNFAAALLAVEGAGGRRLLNHDPGLLHVLKGNSVMLVRAPLNGTAFTRARARPEPPGFRIWLSSGGSVFLKYLNIVDNDGKEFYVEDVASHPYPDADAQSLEGVSP